MTGDGEGKEGTQASATLMSVIPNSERVAARIDIFLKNLQP